MPTATSGGVDGSPKADLLHTRAFNHAFKSVFGVDASIDEIPHQGSTDQLILLAVSRQVAPAWCSRLVVFGPGSLSLYRA